MSSTVDWSVLFSEAGLDITNWNPIDPRWTAPFYADTRMAWIGALPVAANVQVHIEAAAYRGRPVSFVMVGPWTSPVSVRGFAAGAQAPDPRVAAGATLLLVVLGTAGGFVARRNLRLGRGDRRGATRVMLFTLGCWFVSWMAVEHHVADVGEVLLVAGFAGMFLPLAGLLWVSYIAVEPFVRRRWPRLLVSWSRLLAGDWRDPVVGRDVLIGSAAGIASLDLMYGAMLSPSALGRSSGFSPVVDWNLFNGPLSLLGALLSATSFAIAQGLLALLTLLVLRVALRRDWAVAIVLGVGEFFTGPYIVELLWLPVMLKVAQAVVLVFVVVRVGLLASVVLLFFMFLALRTSITIQPSAWYAGISYAVLLVLAGITLYGFRTALGGRPMMGTLAIED